MYFPWIPQILIREFSRNSWSFAKICKYLICGIPFNKGFSATDCTDGHRSFLINSLAGQGNDTDGQLAAYL